ncbi:MAG TPA: DNA-directed DNA polymerase II small subunit [Archaeoglobaceae archaeon]|nr:DNA-directed DNA polymerase II small subunit [Archaeoglobaceae archaeon]
MTLRMSSKLIVTKFAMHGYNVHPSVIEILKKEPERNIDKLVSEICKIAGNSFIITPEDVLPVLDSLKSEKSEQIQLKQEVKKPHERCDISLIKDITGSSACEGNVDDFIMYFNSRYEKISRIIMQRPNFTPVNISEVKKLRSDRVQITGIITGIRESMNGNTIIELEDKTGRINVIATGKLKEEADELLGDETIGVEGFVKGRSLIADRIILPEIPRNGRKVEKDFSMVFISDTHFGSNTFLHKEWNTFVKWLNCEVGNEKSVKLAESIKYMIIAGDVVDGVGIYPEQDKELDIIDINEQYEEAALQIEKIPKRIKIILAPGNHDAVRQAEPQPALPKEFADLFPKNVMHVGNPAMLDIEGVKLLIYHGRSIDDFVTKIHRLEYERPHHAMIEMLKRRHLAPLYGNRTLIAPEREDYLVIDDIPDILHCGHVHTYGTAYYRGIFLVNSSCWQTQTEFQKKMNLNPIPGNVAVYKPGGEPVRLNFYSA